MLKKYINNLKNGFTITQLKKLWPFVRPYRIRAFIALLLSIPLGSLDAAIAWSLKPFMDNVMIEKSAETAMYVPLAIVGFSIIQGILTYSVNYLNAWVGFKITVNLKTDMYNKLLGFESKFYEEMQTGHIIMRFSNDVDSACNGLLNQTKLMVTRFFSSISLICVLFFHSWQLALVALVSLAVALYPLKTYRKRIQQFNEDAIAENGKLVANYIQSVNGNKVVASYNLQNKQLSDFVVNINKLFRINMKMTQKTAFLPAVMTLCVSLGIAAIIWFGSYLIVSGEITGGAFVSFITALIMLFNPIKRMGNGFAALQGSLFAMERVFQLYEKDYEIKDDPDAKELKDVKGNIEFKNVNFGYDYESLVLKNLSLKAEPGQTVALVGNSGGGKSTIVNLLPRFYDVQAGEILIDGENIKNYTLESLRDKISMVLQDSFLFTGSIRDNITLGKEYTEEEINNAIKSAYLQDFVDSCEHGLDSFVGENGSSLSGGQKQRVSIARAFLKDSPIVIFDEATSALDNRSEKAVQEAMNELIKGRTVLVIAHRLSTIKRADKIVVINDGEVFEEGTHEELLENQEGIYTRLHAISK